MKTPRIPTKAALTALALALGNGTMNAASVTLTNNDASNTTSLTSAGKWNNGAVPSAANDYYTGTNFIRTPQGSNYVTFAGHSLTLQPPDSQGTPMRSIIYKGAGNDTYIINNLTNAGGVINSGAGNVTPPTFTGNMMYVVSNSTIQADQGSFVIGYPLSGSADLTNTGGRTVYYTNNNSAFTGRFVVVGSSTIAFSNSVSGFPGNPAVSTPDQISLGAGCTLIDFKGMTYNNANGGITLGGAATINSSCPYGSATVIGVPIVDNGGGYSLSKSGGGTLTLSADNVFSGNFNLNGITTNSQLNINNANAIGTGTFVVQGGNFASIDNTSGSAITLANNNAQTWNNDFRFIGTSSLDMGNGTVSIAALRSITVVSNTFSVGQVTDGGAGYGLTKNGNGTLTLNGGGAYVGKTTINGGTLAIIGAGSTMYSTNVFIASGAKLDASAVGGLTLNAGEAFGGSGTMAGSLTDASGVVFIPGGSTTYGTLMVNGDLTLNGGAAMNFDLSNVTTPGSGTNDLIAVSGAFNLAGSTTLNVNFVNGVPPNGSIYTLIQYGSFSGSVDGLVAPAGTYITNNTTAGAIQLVTTHIPAVLTWQGDGSVNVWDVNTTANWLQSGTNQTFFGGDAVTFDNTGSASPAITLTGTIIPGSVTVNASQDYTFTGSGIEGSGVFTKAGSGTLVLDNNNTYTGPTVINGGVLQIGAGASTGTLGTGTVTNNSVLVFNRGDDVTASQAVTGTGSITNAGMAGTVLLSGNLSCESVNMFGYGSLVLSGSNTFAGPTLVSYGTLIARSTNALGSASGATVVRDGGQLFVDVNLNIADEPIFIDGVGVSSMGAIRKGGSGATTLGGPVTLTADATIYVDGGSTLTFTNGAGIQGANCALTLNGAGTGNVSNTISLGTGSLLVVGGTWNVAPTNAYSGKTTLTGGTLAILALPALGSVPASWTPDFINFNGGTLAVNTNLGVNSFEFVDGLRGLTFAAAGTLNVGTGASLTLSNDFTGAGTLTKSGTGTLNLVSSNTFTGTLYVDTSATAGSDGIVRITQSAVTASMASPISIRNNNSGSSTLQLDAVSGSVVITNEFRISCRNNTVPAIQSVSGNNTISGPVFIDVGGATLPFQSDVGLLTFSGEQKYVGTLTGGRTFTFLGAGNFLISGAILNSDNGAPISLAKGGAGMLTLSAANTYGNMTTVSNGVLLLTGSITSTGTVAVAGGTLAGTGVINDIVSVQSGAFLAPGAGNGSVGTLTINSNLTLAGTVSIDVNKSLGTFDRVIGVNQLTYGGTLVVTNLAGTLNVGDTFPIFSAVTPSGNFTSVTGSAGSGKGFSFNPTTGVLSVVQTLPTTPTNITFSVSGNNLILGWPESYKGWILQSQTNSLAVGINTNSASWSDVSGSETIYSTTIPINTANPTVFYRLRYP